MPTPEMLDERVSIHAFHIFSMRFRQDDFGGVSRSRVIEALQAEGLPVSEGYPQPIYRNPLFQQHPHVIQDCTEAEAYCRESVWLPHNALLADDEWIEEAIGAISKVRENAEQLLPE